ncbi:hypothetical protein RFI_01016 [Reticulomyxa filosa]|uniref:Large ribosomal subunit protein uL15/eL18 domain-containing protein n=1 Tax=Reticulomyxa filosa TaxID=46433 RepID=X6PC08_RETFI|nr:hypothetical protein RFI_01016 [Reticulomyxa filosa]|eukprot:ETO36045.1 hypothetical protein RFI_01016 [Reticulomyxa filosa]
MLASSRRLALLRPGYSGSPLTLFPCQGALTYHQIYNWGSCRFDKLKDNPKARKKKKRLGRGPNQSDGRGQKGANVRQGNRTTNQFDVPPILLEQIVSCEFAFHCFFFFFLFFNVCGSRHKPLHTCKKKKKKKKKKSDHSSPFQWLELKKLKQFLDRGELNPGKVITLRELYAVGCIPKIKHGLALVNNDKLEELGYKIHLEVTFVTPAAKQAVEKSGGIIRLKFIPKRHMDRLLRPWKYETKIDNVIFIFVLFCLFHSFILFL